MIRRRSTQVFSLAFLDCICCGFGAIILIFVLSISSQDKDKQKTIESLRRILAARLADTVKLAASTEDLERSNARVASMVVDARLKNDTVHALIDDLERKLQYEKKGQQALLVDLDELKKEIAARQKKPDMVMPEVKPTPVGLPIGSNYIAFVIDTSGSMRDPSTDRVWAIAIRKIDEVLDVYPNVQGIQLLDTDGRFIVGGGRGADKWLPDTPEMRDTIRRAIRRYDGESESSPVNGVYRVLTTLYDPKDEQMKLGIYVFGDEFIGVADPVLRRLDQLNPADEKGNRRVVINAIGFPTTIRYQFSMGNTGLKFANLMREVAYQHGGAFIALQDL